MLSVFGAPGEVDVLVFDITKLAALCGFKFFWVSRVGVVETHKAVCKVFRWARSGCMPSYFLICFPCCLGACPPLFFDKK